MSRFEIALALFLILVALACSSFAGDAAPPWKKGDTWTVRTLQRVVAVVPRGPRGPRIPGAPPRRGGVPEGWKPANRWRLTVDRVAEGETVILLEALEGADKRRVELGFKAGKLVRVGERVLTKRTGLPESRTLAFPLDWPDTFASWKEGARWWSSFECAGIRGELEP